MAERDSRQQDHSTSMEESPCPPLRSQTLFQGKREIVIEHEGQHYRLRITRRNKLILQK
jgi:hemin uptake protein HemP